MPLPSPTRALVPLGAALLLAAVSGPLASAAPAPTNTGRPAGVSPSPTGDQMFSWQLLDTGSFGNITGIDATSDGATWAVTSDTAEVLLTTDGETFSNVAGAEWVGEGLQLYDVEATSADEAIVLAAGGGEASRIFHTPDGGTTWHETYRGSNPLTFINCLAMFDDMRGYAVGDPIDGKYEILTTADGGMSWDAVDPAGIPDAQPDEYEWAASGSCANASGRTAWFGTGNATGFSRVIWSTDFGATWNMSETPIPSAPGSGIFGVDFRTNKVGVVVGGDAGTGISTTARTTDGGATWTLVDGPATWSTGVAWWQDKKGDTRQMGPTPAQKTVFAVGAFGSEVSYDRGKTWESFDASVSLNTISCLQGSAVCMGGGGGGTIAALAVG